MARNARISGTFKILFKKLVFKNVLYRQTLQELREAVRISVPDGLTSTGIRFSGFLFIHKLFILRGMRDSIWKVLSTFGYTVSLDFDENYLIPRCFSFYQFQYKIWRICRISPPRYRFF